VGSRRAGHAIMRLLRVLRGVKSARMLAHFVVSRRAESAFLAATLLSLLLLVACSIAILQFEIPAGGNIATPQDAMWWAVSTMTTVGYGDRYPISAEGRLVAVFLMAAGVGVFGTFSGLVASWFLLPAAAETESDLQNISRQLRDIREQIERGSGAGMFWRLGGCRHVSGDWDLHCRTLRSILRPGAAI
jgi:voltage-gated potassium channel